MELVTISLEESIERTPNQNTNLRGWQNRWLCKKKTI
jgi:hypothetical protein